MINHLPASGRTKTLQFSQSQRINPQSPFKYKKTVLISSMAVLLGHAMAPANAASTDLANAPMAVSNMVTPNVLVVYDNSQSMDAYMNGTLVSGNNPNTRSNIGRTVMRNAIGTYRNTFNWGLMTYEMRAAPDLRNTYAFYMGSDAGMIFTDDCVGYVPGVPPTIGISASNGNRRCIANPQPFPLANFVTFDKTGDDADVQDVLYDDGPSTNIWALTGGPGTAYRFYSNRTPAAANSWTASDFSGDPFGTGPISFTPTDAGYLPQNPPLTRQVYIPRGWGYIKDITGFGSLVEKVDVDSPSHYSTLIASLGNETNGATPEIKNGALFTPLRGSLESAKTYFSTSMAGNTSPVQYSCQQNFVMMVTDGLPTGNASGNLYSETERANSCTWNTTSNSCTTGSFGSAATEARTAANALRTTNVTGFSSTNKDGTGAVTGKYDVQTYIVALGETVANANALSVMNSMAFSGGTGKAIAAGDATAFQNAIRRISDDITAKVGSASAVAVANARVTSLDNASYTSSYNSGTWTGDLSANAIDVTTGVASATPLWTAGSASTQLDLRTSANRFIATSTDAGGGIGGVQFQPTTASTATKLSAAQQTLLGASDGAAVLAYLRGDRSGEPGTYRARSHLLGDMINAEPVLVREPSASYTDTGYSAFKTTNASRTRMLYQAANDGMLHAFAAATGAESWAYVPNLIIKDLSDLTLTSGFTHQYYVDGTPASADVDFANIDGNTIGGDWRTILVGGLGKGGRGYYALDVSSPTASTEVDVKNKVLWEFPNSITNNGDRDKAKKDMGYSFGKPLLVKTRAKGWVVLLTSGYNNGSADTNGDGKGHLYVVNPKTGDLIEDIKTNSCTSSPDTNPCGLAQISASLAANNTVDYVYGGDLKGNVWRFDLTGNSSGSWSVSKFANLADTAAVPQPITTAPQLKRNASMRMVYVGTGQYLGNTDIPGSAGANVSSSQTQTMYGLNDSLTALPTPLRSNLQQQTLITSALTRTITNNPVDYAVKKGWYIDLPITGERLFTEVATYSNNLVFTSNIPSSTKCEPGGSSWIQVVNSKTGGLADFTGSGAVSGISFGTVLTSSPVLFQLPNNSWNVIVNNSARTPCTSGSLQGGGAGASCKSGANNTKTFDLPSPPSPASAIKRSWRQLFLY